VVPEGVGGRERTERLPLDGAIPHDHRGQREPSGGGGLRQSLDGPVADWMAPTWVPNTMASRDAVATLLRDGRRRCGRPRDRGEGDAADRPGEERERDERPPARAPSRRALNPVPPARGWSTTVTGPS
jgi:hypothetical protein